jgi:glycosyltransferase involved in cell wall biosynthesis
LPYQTEEFQLTKKICFIFTDAISLNVLCRGQLEYFRDYSGLDVTLIAGGDSKQLELLKKRQVGKVVNAKIKRKPSPVQDIKSLVFLMSYLKSNNFDLIVYSTPKALLLGSIAGAFNLKSKKIAVVHGRVYENFTGLKKLIFQSFDQLSFFLSNKVVFVSKSLLQNYIDDKILDNKTGKVIKQGSFNGVNISVFHPVNSDEKFRLRAELGLPQESFLICVVGRICIDKGIRDIKLLAEKLKDKRLKFVFVGSFEDDKAREIVKEITERHQGYYLPHTPRVYEIFQCSDLHLFLSHREGFGNVAVEAASCGIPTFAYDVVGVKDSVNDGISGQRFNFQDISAVSQAITESVYDDDFEQKYSGARDWVVENFDQEEVWDSYLKFYLANIN